jgi:hypothetical protein
VAINPYAPPQVDLGVPPGVAPLDPAAAQAIQARIQRLNGISLGLGIPGLLIQFAGMAFDASIRPLFQLVGGGLLIAGLTFYARMKGRSGWWGLMGLLSILGLIILAVLPAHCHNCGQTVKGNRCKQCGAPSGPK